MEPDFEVLKQIQKYPRVKPFNIDKIKITDKRIVREKKAGRSAKPRKLRKISDEKFLKDYLTSLYNLVEKPGTFQGIEKLQDAVTEDGLYKITTKQIKQFLENNFAYSLNRPVKKVKKRPKVIVAGLDDQFDADLADMKDAVYSDANKKVKYLLVVIDIFSRFLWIKPLRDKEAKTVVKAFSEIFASSKRKPRRIRTDRGKEFTSEVTKNFFEREKIHQMFTSNEVQANYAERVIKTVKSKIFRYMTSRNTFKYLEMLPKFVESYNNTWHHGIRAKPVDVNEKNEKRLWWQMYWPEENVKEKKIHQKRKSKRKINFKFEIGDQVRISVTRKAFDREYDQRWTGEVFIVKSRFMREGNIPMYKINDYGGSPMTGSYYENEMQKISPVSKEDLFVISEILDSKIEDNVKYVKVSYRYWPAKYNRWIKESIIKDLTKKRKTISS